MNGRTINAHRDASVSDVVARRNSRSPTSCEPIAQKPRVIALVWLAVKASSPHYREEGAGVHRVEFPVGVGCDDGSIDECSKSARRNQQRTRRQRIACTRLNIHANPNDRAIAQAVLEVVGDLPCKCGPWARVPPGDMREVTDRPSGQNRQRGEYGERSDVSSCEITHLWNLRTGLRDVVIDIPNAIGIDNADHVLQDHRLAIAVRPGDR